MEIPRLNDEEAVVAQAISTSIGLSLLDLGISIAGPIALHAFGSMFRATCKEMDIDPIQYMEESKELEKKWGI